MNRKANHTRTQKQILYLFDIFHRFICEKSKISESMRIFYYTKRNVNNQSRWVIIGYVWRAHTHTRADARIQYATLWLCVSIVWLLLFPIESKNKSNLHNSSDAENMQSSCMNERLKRMNEDAKKKHSINVIRWDSWHHHNSR